MARAHLARGSLSFFVPGTSLMMMIMMAVAAVDLGLRAAAQKLPFMLLHSFVPANTFSLFSGNRRSRSRDLTMGEVAIFRFLKPKRTKERTNLAMKQ